MQKKQTAQKYLSQIKGNIPTSPDKASGNSWEEYSCFHDSFADLLSYENNFKIGSDFWQLNYI